MNEALGHSLWAALALMLIIEGMLPFLNPALFRQALQRMIAMRDQQIRISGLLSMLVGLAVLYWVN